MTTIIVVAIVALVFFVAICVAAFMIWKQETQMRTDSLKGIEGSLNDVLYELSDRRPNARRYTESVVPEYQEHTERRRVFQHRTKAEDRRHAENIDTGSNYDPFKWSNKEKDIDVKVFRPSDIHIKREEPEGKAETKPSIVDVIEVVDGTKPVSKIEDSMPAEIEETKQTAEPEITETVKSETFEENLEEGIEEDLEIDLSLIDIDDLFDIDEILFEEKDLNEECYSTGRSGRKYTAEELESLIKE